MTQILFYTRSATSVFLDLFVRHFCGVLKYNLQALHKFQRFLLTIKFMQRVNICGVGPPFSRPLQFALATCQSTSEPKRGDG